MSATILLFTRSVKERNHNNNKNGKFQQNNSVKLY